MNTELSLTQRVTAQLRESIERGEFPEGYQLPSERVLAPRYNVSRITVRRALQELEATGFVHRRGTSGTFVSPEADRTPEYESKSYIPGIPEPLPVPIVDGEPPMRSGLWSEEAHFIQIVDLAPPGLVRPNHHIGMNLRLERDVLVLRRLRLAMGFGRNPVEIWDSFTPGSFVEAYFRSNPEHLEIEKWLREKHGRIATHGTIYAIPSSPTTFEQLTLNIGRKALVMHVSRRIEDQHHVPIEFSHICTPLEYYRIFNSYDTPTLEVAEGLRAPEPGPNESVEGLRAPEPYSSDPSVDGKW